MSLPLRRHACRVRTVTAVTDGGTDVVRRTSEARLQLLTVRVARGDGRGRQVGAVGTGTKGPNRQVVVPKTGPTMRNSTRYAPEVVVRQIVTDVCLGRSRVPGTFRGSSGFK